MTLNGQINRNYSKATPGSHMVFWQWIFTGYSRPQCKWGQPSVLPCGIKAKRKKQKEDVLKRLQRERDAKEYQQKRQIELELKQAKWEENKKLFAILIVIVAVIAFFIAVIMAMPFMLFFLAFPAVMFGIIWIIWILFEKAFQK